MKKVLTLALLGVIFACGRNEHQGKPSVAVSISPIGWLVEEIADTLLDVEVVLPDGSGAESYDPTPRQVASVSKADIYFHTGLLDFEKGLLEKIGEEKSVRLCESVEVIGEDPHIWLSVRNMRLMARSVYMTLKTSYPDLQQIEMRYHLLDSTLEDMDHRFSKIFAGNENVLIVHPSLTYLSRDYGFTQIPVEVDGKEPSAVYLKQIFDLIRSKNIKAIYYSIQDNPTEAIAIASDAGIEADKYNPLAFNWKEELEAFVEKICRK